VGDGRLGAPMNRHMNRLYDVDEDFDDDDYSEDGTLRYKVIVLVFVPT